VASPVPRGWGAGLTSSGAGADTAALVRAIDIAANASMSKQAVKPPIDHLEGRGYLTRVADPEDHRAQRIHTTARGQKQMAAASAINTDIDRDIEQQLGPSKNAQLRAILEDLATITTHTPPSADGTRRSKPPRQRS
jgi:DNA-binding MarR family transcriptional regulator